MISGLDTMYGESLCGSMNAETWNQYISLTEHQVEKVNCLIDALLDQQLDGRQ